MEYLKDRFFEEWLKENEIIYEDKDDKYIEALYSEYLIEQETKKIK